MIEELDVSLLVGGSGSACVVAAGELDVASAPRLARVLSDASSLARRVVLDLRALSYLDATGAAVIVRAAETLPTRLSVVPPTTGAGRRFLEVTRAGALLPS